MVEGRSRFRTIGGVTLPEARHERELLQLAAANGELPLSPQMTFEAVATRWLAEFETKVAAGERRERTLDLYRSQLRVHLLPRLGRRRMALLGPDDVAAVRARATGRRSGAVDDQGDPRRTQLCLHVCAPSWVTSARTRFGGSSVMSGRVRCAPTNGLSAVRSSLASSPPVHAGTVRCSQPASSTVHAPFRVLALQAGRDVDLRRAMSFTSAISSRVVGVVGRPAGCRRRPRLRCGLDPASPLAGRCPARDKRA